MPHDATIHQMESSGSLRYFTDASLNRDVAQYDQLCRKWGKVEQIDIGIYTEVRKAGQRFSNQNIMKQQMIFTSQTRIY